jgi:hypothetical protein
MPEERAAELTVLRLVGDAVELDGPHPCTVCGSANAPFGYGPPGVSVTREPDRFRWYCGAHRPCDLVPPEAERPSQTKLKSSKKQENQDD